ncbi:hypothetical protein ACHAAC_06660 [Aeromicrobium sp. CF4.19]|uniref:hypothetical protein n=1 Tax=Aeromicrobium sp. CF4.19 TaxID=3373082 RepID=UPI003EE5632C
MTTAQVKPDPLKDIYQLSIAKAHDAALDVEVPIELVPEYVDAAAYFGVRLGKTWDDVMTDCINYSITEMQRSGEHE